MVIGTFTWFTLNFILCTVRYRVYSCRADSTYEAIGKRNIYVNNKNFVNIKNKLLIKLK